VALGWPGRLKSGSAAIAFRLAAEHNSFENVACVGNRSDKEGRWLLLVGAVVCRSSGFAKKAKVERRLKKAGASFGRMPSGMVDWIVDAVACSCCQRRILVGRCGWRDKEGVSRGQGVSWLKAEQDRGRVT